MRVLIPEKLAEPGVELLRKDFDVDVELDLSPDELLGRIDAYDGLIVRSATQVTAEVIELLARDVEVGVLGLLGAVLAVVGVAVALLVRSRPEVPDTV